MKTLKQILNSTPLNSFFHKKNGSPSNISQLWITEGYIKVDIKGISLDKIEINESFTADQFDVNNVSYSNSYWINHQDHGRIAFNLRRSCGIDRQKDVNITFLLDGDSISNEEIQITFIKKINENKILDLRFSESQMPLFPDETTAQWNPKQITNLKFDIKTQQISGDFRFEDTYFSSIYISGDFKMKLTQRVI